MVAKRFKVCMKLFHKETLIFLLVAGRAVAQVPLSEKNISLEEVQVKPRVPKIWVQKGKAPLLPRLAHYIRYFDPAGKQIPLPVYLNKAEVISPHVVQVSSVETKLEPFENDSFDVFFFALQVAGTDTLITRKLVLGKEIRRKHCILKFAPGELTLLPQPVYIGFEFVPNKVSTSYRYELHTATKKGDSYLYHRPSKSIVKEQGEFGVTFNFRMAYYEL